jgi:putative transposase
MPDHLHLLIATGETALSKSIGSFSQFTSTETNRSLGLKGNLWQHGFYEHRIRKSVEKCPALVDYIHHNPVRKGLCDLPEQWRWSTAHPKYSMEIEPDWFW